MATQQDSMTTFSSSGSASSRKPTKERRGSRRCKISQLMLIRPSDPEKDHFDDMRGTLSVSRSGVYFQTNEAGYEMGMRLFVTMPYSNSAAAMSREYLAEVVRKESLPTGMTGIGLKILLEMGLQDTNFSFSTPVRR
jgi:hypothetical protein